MDRKAALALVVAVAGCSTPEPPPPPEPVRPVVVEEPRSPPPSPVTEAPPVKPPAPELPFDPSPDDKAAFDIAGYTGSAKVPPETGFAQGPRIADVKAGGFAAAAGMKAGDVIVEFAGVSFPEKDDDAIGTLRKRLNELPFDSDTQVKVWREAEGVRELTVHLGRRPPPFANLDTPSDWLGPVAVELRDEAVAKLIADAVALDHGEERYADVLARNRKHLSKTDSFRLKEVTQAHLDLAANERIAKLVHAWPPDLAGLSPEATLRLTEQARPFVPRFTGATLDELADHVARVVQVLDLLTRAITPDWTPDDREFVEAEFHRLSQRLNESEYLYDDTNVARERANRRIVRLLGSVDRNALALAAAVADSFVGEVAPRAAELARADGREGLLVARDTVAGRVEIWGAGNTRHTARCAFCFDLGGNDDWLDCAGRATPEKAVSIAIDWTGDDTYGGTSPFNEGGALGGVGILWDQEGDDQYVARSWSQGCGVAGWGRLVDNAGRDTYHGQDECQGVGFAGCGLLQDRREGGDLYTGDRFCQGVGFPGGIGELSDEGRDADRYVCTGRYDSEYGEPGLFSGWGQGVGFGFRGIASGGVGILYDLAGDDVYEAGNFSQGGGYFYGWGILRDDAGNDRYIGSRYAQGWAAHQAVGTFLEGGGNDLYQSHSSVADGLSWDETSVVFHDMGGDDVYEQGGFSLGSAAHNGMVLFLDDGGNDRYPALSMRAGPNDYHGGKSFALFVDRGGEDVYGAAKPGEWNDRVHFDDGYYFVDLPPSPGALGTYVR